VGAKGRFSKALEGYLHGAKAQDDATVSIQQSIKDVQAQVIKIKKISDGL
jgi:hypothetical protein